MKNFYDVCDRISRELGSDTGNAYYKANAAVLIKGDDINRLSFLKSRTRDLLAKPDYKIDMSTVPSWYSKSVLLEDAVLAEAFGWGVVQEWFTDSYKDSPVFIISGENCFIDRDGHTKLMKQRMTPTLFNRIKDTIAAGWVGPESYEITLNNGLTVTWTGGDEMVLSRSTPSTVTKQDITLELWSKFLDKEAGLPLDINAVESCNMRKTNSFGIKLKDGREFKVIVKDMGEDD